MAKFPIIYTIFTMADEEQQFFWPLLMRFIALLLLCQLIADTVGKGSDAFDILAGLVWGGAAVLFMLSGFGAFGLGMIRARWEKTVARLVSATVHSEDREVDVTNSDSDNRVYERKRFYWIESLYEYTVDHIPYTGKHKVAATENEEEIQKLAQSMPPGKETAVYFDPKAPSSSSLSHFSSAVSWFVLFITTGAGLFGLFIALSLLLGEIHCEAGPST